MQSVQRGRKDRARVRALRIEERRQAHAEAIGEYDTLGMDESAAAIKIQSITRGRQARREVAQLRAEVRLVQPVDAVLALVLLLLAALPTRANAETHANTTQ